MSRVAESLNFVDAFLSSQFEVARIVTIRLSLSLLIEEFHIGSGIAGFGRLCLVGVDVCHQISAGFDDGVRIRYFAGADGVVLLAFLPLS